MKYTKKSWEKAIRALGLNPKSDEQIDAELGDIIAKVTEVILPHADSDVRPLVERFIAEFWKMQACFNDPKQTSYNDDEWRRLIEEFGVMGGIADPTKPNKMDDGVQHWICAAMRNACYSHGYERFLEYFEQVKKELKETGVRCG